MRLVYLPAVATLLVATLATDLLFVDSLLSYGSYEPGEARALGLSSTTVTTLQWSRMTTKDFAAFKAIIISDPAPGQDPFDLQFLEDTAATWGPAIQGNIIIQGTDASNHYKGDLIGNSIRFAAAGKSSSGSRQTGLYLSLSQYYDTDDISPVPALSYFGNFTVRGNLVCYNEARIVATSPAIENLTDTYLSNWGCSVHEAFSSYPTAGKDGFQALAIADGITGQGTQNFAQGHYGLPYIISRGATPAGCGDGHWDKSIGEECDDGNTNDGDGCSKSCKCESGFAKGDGTCYPSASSDGLVRMPEQFTDVYYFTGVYLCVIITVLFKTLWGIVLASTKMIEPFYQLHKEGGASADESLLSDYLSLGPSRETLKNIFRGHWVMTLTTAVFLAANVSMAVASDSMKIRSGNSCTTPEDPMKCDLQWVIDVKIARALQGLMGLSALMILLRIFLGRKRTSGVSTYPCTIASMVALLSSPFIINTFMGIHPETKKKEMAKVLSQNYYGLCEYEVSPGDVRYGLAQFPAPPSRGWWDLSRLLSSRSTEASPQPAANTSTQEKPKPQRDRSKLKANLFHGLFLAIHLALFGTFLYYRLTQNPTIFVTKRRLSLRTIFTIITIILSHQWSRLEAEVRIITPYRGLSRSSSKSKSNSRHILKTSLHGVPLTTFFTALRHGNLYHALIAFVAVLSEFLTIAVVGIPYNIGVIQDVSLFSSTACLGLLGAMIVTALSVFMWRAMNPDMPRRPDTIADCIMMLCASGMVRDFEGVGQGMVGRGDLEETMEGRKYVLGKKRGVDGRERMVIDVVEVRAEDQHAHGHCS